MPADATALPDAVSVQLLALTAHELQDPLLNFCVNTVPAAEGEGDAVSQRNAALLHDKV